MLGSSAFSVVQKDMNGNIKVKYSTLLGKQVSLLTQMLVYLPSENP